MENEKHEHKEQAQQQAEILTEEELDEVSGGLARVRHRYAVLADLKVCDDQPSLRRTIQSDLRAV